MIGAYDKAKGMSHAAAPRPAAGSSLIGGCAWLDQAIKPATRMAAAPVGVDRVLEPERRALDPVDDPLGPDVQELHAAELTPPRLTLEDRVVEERGLGLGCVCERPAQLTGGHRR